MLYFLVVNDFVNKTTRTVNIFTDYRNAYNAMEEFIADYITEKEGLNDGPGNKFPLYNSEKKPGYYVDYKREGKFSVKRLESEKICQPGWIKNTYVYNLNITKIFTIQIVECNSAKVENNMMLRKFQSPEDICYSRYESNSGMKKTLEARNILTEFAKRFSMLECFTEIENNPVSNLRSMFPKDFKKCTHALDTVLETSKIEFSQSINNKILNGGVIEEYSASHITESLMQAVTPHVVVEEGEWKVAGRKKRSAK